MLNKCVKLFFIVFFLFGSICLTADLAYADDNTNNAAAEEAETQEEQDNKTCNMEAIREEYFGHNEEEAEEKCWYCRMVIIMTNAFLQAAATTLPVTQELGYLILKLGFCIWLAIFFLKQLSAMNGLTPGKMLQEIMVMGFKCAFAYYAIKDGLPFIKDYILNPILITGTDIGSAILDKMLEGMDINAGASGLIHGAE